MFNENTESCVKLAQENPIEQGARGTRSRTGGQKRETNMYHQLNICERTHDAYGTNGKSNCDMGRDTILVTSGDHVQKTKDMPHIIYT